MCRYNYSVPTGEYGRLAAAGATVMSYAQTVQAAQPANQALILQPR